MEILALNWLIPIISANYGYLIKSSLERQNVMQLTINLKCNGWTLTQAVVLQSNELIPNTHNYWSLIKLVITCTYYKPIMHHFYLFSFFTSWYNTGSLWLFIFCISVFSAKHNLLLSSNDGSPSNTIYHINLAVLDGIKKYNFQYNILYSAR